MGAYRRPIKFKRRRIPRRHSKYIVKLTPNTTVLFIVVFIIACIIGTVILGNHLKQKAEENRPSILDTVTNSEEETTKTSSGVSSIGKADGHIRSGCLDISYTTSKEKLEVQLRNMFASGFDSVTLPIEKDGSLLYYFPAAVTLSYMSENENLPSLTETIETIKSIGAEYGINPTVTAYYVLTSSKPEDPVLKEVAYLFDTAIIAEAYTLGADEVLVSGFENDFNAEEILAFAEKLKSASSGIKIGFAFAPEVYLTDENASTLEKISAEISFLAIDTFGFDWTYSVTNEPVYSTDEDGEAEETTETVILSQIYGQIEEFLSYAKGNISLYGLRFVLDGTHTYTLSEAIDVLYSKGAFDFYVAATSEDSFSPVTPETTEADIGSDVESEEETTKRPSSAETTAPSTTESTASTEKPKETETVPLETEPETTEPETTVPETVEPIETEPIETEASVTAEENISQPE